MTENTESEAAATAEIKAIVRGLSIRLWRVFKQMLFLMIAVPWAITADASLILFRACLREAKARVAAIALATLLTSGTFCTLCWATLNAVAHATVDLHPAHLSVSVQIQIDDSFSSLIIGLMRSAALTISCCCYLLLRCLRMTAVLLIWFPISSVTLGSVIISLLWLRL